MAHVPNENRLVDHSVKDQIVIRSSDPHRDASGGGLRSDTWKRAKPIRGYLNCISDGNGRGRVIRGDAGENCVDFTASGRGVPDPHAP